MLKTPNSSMFSVQHSTFSVSTRTMFGPSLEVILTVAYREAATRHHTHLTLEHLLYALSS